MRADISPPLKRSPSSVVGANAHGEDGLATFVSNSRTLDVKWRARVPIIVASVSGMTARQASSQYGFSIGIYVDTLGRTCRWL